MFVINGMRKLYWLQVPVCGVICGVLAERSDIKVLKDEQSVQEAV